MILKNTKENNMKRIYPPDFKTHLVNAYLCGNSITQLANEIDLMVKEKVGKDEIIADLNIAVKDGQGIIELIGNIVKIDSDHCTLSEDGILTLRNTTTEPYIYTINDVMSVLKYLRGEQTLTNGLLKLYDYDSDGEVTIFDLVGMTNVINGTETSIKYADAEITLNPLSPSEFIKMTLYGEVQCRIGLNEVYNYTFRGMHLFLGTYADMNNQYGISLNGEKGIVTVTSEEASTNTVIDAGKIDAYNVYASSGGGKGYCMHGIDAKHTYRCNWGQKSNTDFFEVYVDSAQIPLIKTSPETASQISEMQLKTSYVEFIVPRIWSIFYFRNCTIRY
jgi:hypothetical protein